MGPLPDAAAVDLLSSQTPPWWAQPKNAVGILVLIAGGLVWFLRSDVLVGQEKLQDALKTHAQELAAHAQASTAGQEKELQLLYLLCRNTAQTDREATNCDAVMR